MLMYQSNTQRQLKLYNFLSDAAFMDNGWSE